jgi:predicted AAA+ superfamily ATPase
LFKPYRLALASLCIYRNILRDPLLQSLLQLLEQGIKEADSISTRDAYYEFLYQLFQSGMSFKNYLIDLIRYDDNPFSRACELSDIDNIDQVLLAAARQDLRNLHFLYKLDFRSLEERLGIRETALDLAHYAPNSLAVKLDEAKDWVSQIEILAEYHQTHSRGIIARYKAFSFSSPLGLQGIEKPDLPAMDDLIGCSRQKELLCHNTENFLKGHPANNVLLYGPRGTGKSTMIRALLSKYGDQALRLIQLDREQIDCLPELMALLAGYNVRFIIFIDDLSFEEHETKYKALKAVLEGGLVCQPSNVLIYATLMMTIGGSVAAFMAVADIVYPTPYYQSFEEYKQYDKQRDPNVDNLEKLSETELKARYDAMVESELNRQKSRAQNTLIKSLGWIIVPLPVFVYYQRRLREKED